MHKLQFIWASKTVFTEDDGLYAVCYTFLNGIYQMFDSTLLLELSEKVVLWIIRLEQDILLNIL